MYTLALFCRNYSIPCWLIRPVFYRILLFKTYSVSASLASVLFQEILGRMGKFWLPTWRVMCLVRFEQGVVFCVFKVAATVSGCFTRKPVRPTAICTELQMIRPTIFNCKPWSLTYVFVTLPPFSMIRDFRKQNKSVHQPFLVVCSQISCSMASKISSNWSWLLLATL